MQTSNWLMVAVATPMLVIPPQVFAVQPASNLSAEVRPSGQFTSSEAVILLSRIPHCSPENQDPVIRVLGSKRISRASMVGALEALRAMLGQDRVLSLKASSDPETGDESLTLTVGWNEDDFVDEYTAVIENWLMPLEDRVGQRGFLAVA